MTSITSRIAGFARSFLQEIERAHPSVPAHAVLAPLYTGLGEALAALPDAPVSLPTAAAGSQNEAPVQTTDKGLAHTHQSVIAAAATLPRDGIRHVIEELRALIAPLPDETTMPDPDAAPEAVPADNAPAAPTTPEPAPVTTTPEPSKSP